MQKVVFTLLLLLFSISSVAEVKTINGKKEITIPPATLNIIYPKTMPSLIEDNYYPFLLLKTALKRSGYRYTLTPAAEVLGQNRVLKEIEKGTIDVSWTMTNKEREERLLPIRVPLFKGLFGWRVMFINEQNLAHLSQLKTLDDLKHIYFLQGQDWPDTKILRDNGLVVSTSLDLEFLFVMLERGRGDLFPRSILEINDEYEVFKNQMSLAVLPQLMLKYKSPIYYFFNKNDPEVAKAVNKGLKIMRETGEFDELFYQYNGEIIKNAHLHDKIVIELRNYDLPRLTPVNDKSLWLSFDQVP